jgi:hypothetical protein
LQWKTKIKLKAEMESLMKIIGSLFVVTACGVLADGDLSDYSGFPGVGPTYTAEYPDQVPGPDLPEYSWDTVPRWLAVRNRDPFSNEQVSSIATNYQLVMLEKANQQGHATTSRFGSR